MAESCVLAGYTPAQLHQQLDLLTNIDIPVEGLLNRYVGIIKNSPGRKWFYQSFIWKNRAWYVFKINNRRMQGIK
jgi:hypothetical protein